MTANVAAPWGAVLQHCRYEWKPEQNERLEISAPLLQYSHHKCYQCRQLFPDHAISVVWLLELIYVRFGPGQGRKIQ